VYGFVGQSIHIACTKETSMRRPLSLAAAIVAAICLQTNSAHAQTLEDIIATNIKSKGGLEKIKATTTVRMSGSVVARDMAGQDVTGTMAMVAKRPNLMRRDATVGGQRIVNGFDGTSLWMAMGTQPPQELPGQQAAYARQDAEFDSVFVDYKEKGHKIELVGKETVGGQPVYHLRVTKKGGRPQDFYLDAETGLEKKISVTLETPDGAVLTSVTEFLDYRSVDGRLVPFMTRQIQNGKLTSTITMDKVEFNVPVEDSFFKMSGK
jgi:outer membrane lipoprotein-sorting protein